MNKNLIVTLLFPLVFGLVSCGNNNSSEFSIDHDKNLAFDSVSFTKELNEEEMLAVETGVFKNVSKISSVESSNVLYNNNNKDDSFYVEKATSKANIKGDKFASVNLAFESCDDTPVYKNYEKQEYSGEFCLFDDFIVYKTVQDNDSKLNVSSLAIDTISEYFFSFSIPSYSDVFFGLGENNHIYYVAFESTLSGKSSVDVYGNEVTLSTQENGYFLADFNTLEDPKLLKSIELEVTKVNYDTFNNVSDEFHFVSYSRDEKVYSYEELGDNEGRNEFISMLPTTLANTVSISFSRYNLSFDSENKPILGSLYASGNSYIYGSISLDGSFSSDENEPLDMNINLNYAYKFEANSTVYTLDKTTETISVEYDVKSTSISYNSTAKKIALFKDDAEVTYFYTDGDSSIYQYFLFTTSNDGLSLSVNIMD